MSSPAYVYDFNQQTTLPAPLSCEQGVIPVLGNGHEAAISLGRDASIVKDYYVDGRRMLELSWRKVRPSWFSREAALSLAESNKKAILKVAESMKLGGDDWWGGAISGASSVFGGGCISEHRRPSREVLEDLLDATTGEIVDTLLDGDPLSETVQIEDAADAQGDAPADTRDATLSCEIHADCVQTCIDDCLTEACAIQCASTRCGPEPDNCP